MVRVLYSSQNSIHLAFKCVQYVNGHDIPARGSPRPRPRAVVVIVVVVIPPRANGRGNATTRRARDVGQRRVRATLATTRRRDATRGRGRRDASIDFAPRCSRARSARSRVVNRLAGSAPRRFTTDDLRRTTDDGRFAFRAVVGYPVVVVVVVRSRIHSSRSMFD